MNKFQINNKQYGAISVAIICVMIILFLHHLPGKYMTSAHIFPQEIMSAIAGSIMGACIGYYVFITYHEPYI
jgi:prolipoprotein diacylglyceryltransferase